jgi:general secretion pathway protein I
MSKAQRRTAGFTLVEVLVALAIVAVALLAGVRATAALAHNAQRQTDQLLAQLCAENALVGIRLTRQMPPVGETVANCTQAGRELQLTLSVRPTPNPEFRRVDARVSDDGVPLLRLSTVVTRY